MTGKRRAAASRNDEKSSKNTPPETDINENELDPEEIEQHEIQPKLEILSSQDLPESASNELKDLLAGSEMLEQGFTATLYKFDNDYTGTSKAVCDKWYEEIKDEHSIGLEYGSGRFMVVVRASDKKGKRKVKGVTFKIHKRYDDLRNQQSKITNDPLLAALMTGKGGGANDILTTITIMEKLMSVFTPLIQQQQQPAGSGINELLIQNYKNTSAIIKEIMMDNLQLVNDMRRDAAGVGEVFEDEDEVTGVQGFIKTFAPILEKFIPLITSKNETSNAAAAALKASGQYRKIVQNKKDLTSVITYLDNKHGAKKTNALLKKMGLQRPQ